jgi:hypothetical protein
MSLRELHDEVAATFGISSVQLKAGYPVRTLECKDSITLASSGLTSNDRLHVILPSGKKEAASPTGGRRRRKAAEKAEASFAETIAAQDALSAQETSRRKKASSGAEYPPSRFAPKKSAAATARHFAAVSSGSARRLRDGAVVNSPASKRSKKTIARPLSEEDAVTSLVESAGRRGGAWRQAVEDVYQDNQAVARLSSIQAGTAVFQVVSDSGTSESQLPIMRVTYPKGVQGSRGSYVDTVDYLNQQLIREVVKGIHSDQPETLRPLHLSKLSPRVLWSLVYQYQQHHEFTGVDVSEALKWLAPELDFSFLRRRREQLSAKALENLRQQQTEQGDNWEAAADAVESVQRAMESSESYERKRQEQHQELTVVEDNWELVTPDEEDEDELKICVSTSPLPGMSVEDTVRFLLESCHVHNWRELANVSDAANWMGKLPGSKEDVGASVQAWIDHAQQNSLQELMMEICDGNADVVNALEEHAATATPKDLAAWRSIADQLREELPDSLAVETKDLLQWCHRAHRCLDQYEWLQLYNTPI